MPFIQLSQSVGGVAPYERWDAGTAPALSAVATARVYFDSVSNTLKLSNNGGAYFDIATGASSPWNNTTTVGAVTENTLTDQVLIGTLATFAGRKLQVQETGINKGIRVQSAAAADNVLDWYDTVNAQAMLSLTGQDFSVFGLPADAVPRAYLYGGSVGAAKITLSNGLLADNTSMEFGGLNSLVFSAAAGAASANLLPKTDVSGTLGDALTQWGVIWVKRGVIPVSVGDPVALAGRGQLYTKNDGTPEAQLFYRSDLASGGAISQLTPNSGATPWQRTGTTVRLDQPNDDFVLPFADAATYSTEVGTKDFRWFQFAASNSFNLYKTVGDVSPSASMRDASLAFGPGGTATDVGLFRSTTRANTMTVSAGFAGGSGSLTPNLDNTGTLGENVSGNAADTRRWASVQVACGGSGVGGLRVFRTAGDANPTTVVAFGEIIMGLGGTGAGTALDTRIYRTSPAELTVDNNAGGAIDIVPGSSGLCRIGTSGLQFAEVNAVIINGGTITGGDIHLRDDARNSHWILREEEDRILLINVVKGKKYAMAMTPIDE